MKLSLLFFFFFSLWVVLQILKANWMVELLAFVQGSQPRFGIKRVPHYTGKGKIKEQMRVKEK